MPLWSYLLVHSEAKLTAADRRTLCDWAKAAPRGK
jgi:Haem-binding domain